MISKFTDGKEDYIEIIKSDGRFSSMFISFIGMPRWSGKTFSSEKVIERFIRAGTKVIEISDQKDTVEAGFMQFPPEAEFHKRLLNAHSFKPVEFHKICPECRKKIKFRYAKCPECSYEFKDEDNLKVPEIEVRVNHPYTKNIPNKKEPETNYYTLSIKKALQDDEIKFILEDDRESTVFNMIKMAVNSLKRDEGLFKLMHRIDHSKGSNEIDYELFCTADDSKPDKKISRDIKQRFYNLFMQNYCLFPDNYDKNLDIRKILKDTSKVDIFITRRLGKNKKEKEFHTFHLINEIFRNKDFIPKQGLLINMKEISDLCPKKLTGYKMIFVDSFSRVFRIAGSSRISVIADCQTQSLTSKEVMNLFTQKFVGKTLSSPDLKDYASVYKLDSYKIGEIKRLQRGEFIDIGEDSNKKPIIFFPPPFMHHEEAYHYDDMFRKHFPHRMHNYHHIVEEIGKHIGDQRNYFEKIEKAKIMRKKEKLDRKIKEAKRKGAEKEKIESEKERKRELKKLEDERYDNALRKLVIKYPNMKNPDLVKMMYEEKGIKTNKETLRRRKKKLGVGKNSIHKKDTKSEKKEDFVQEEWLEKNLHK